MERIPLRIVFEDEYLIVIEKREGLLSVGTSRGRKEITAHRLLNNYLQNTCGGGRGSSGRGRELGRGRGTKTAQNVPGMDAECRSGTKTAQNVPGIDAEWRSGTKSAQNVPGMDAEWRSGTKSAQNVPGMDAEWRSGTKSAQNVPGMGAEWRSGTKSAQNVPGMHGRGYGAAPRAFIVHRLDRETSGLMVFAKSEEVKLRMQENWDSMVTHRGYVAVVNGMPDADGCSNRRAGNVTSGRGTGSRGPGREGKPGGEGEQMQGTVRSWLKENSAFIVYSSPRNNGGQLAITHYKVLGSSGKRGKSLIELELETGRKNQIRVHMQELGCPIYGDKKYFGDNPAQLAESKKARRLYLHAHILDFIHPVTGKEMKFTTGIPRAFREEV